MEIKLPNWSPRKDSEMRVASALVLVQAILNVSEQMVQSHLRESLSIAIWKYTECNGKYTTRFRSRGAVESPKSKLNHEHVFTRKSLIDELLGSPENSEIIMSKAVACTVLTSEHALLRAVEKQNPSLVGWNRYRAAGIEVFDLAEQRLFI